MVGFTIHLESPRAGLLAMCFILLLAAVPSDLIEVHLERIEQIGGEHLVNFSGTRVRKFNRTVSIMDGTFTVLEDMDDSYEITFTVAYSRLGNNQFNEYPMKVPRKKICVFLLEEYLEYQHIWFNKTNLPQVTRGCKEFCPLPKGEYWVKEFAPDGSWVPPVIPEGFWRMTVGVYGPTEELEGQIRVFYRVKIRMY